MEICEILSAFSEELNRAMKIHPVWPTDPVHAAAKLSEEAGEVLQAANDILEWKSTDIERMKTEAIQAGAMAIRFLLNIEKLNIPGGEK